MATGDLSVNRLRELFHYDETTGIFTRIANRGKGRIGNVLNCLDKEGYIQVMIDRKKYKAHRLVWLYVYGEWPTNHIDHINGEPADNRLANLREATDAFNQQNRHSKNGKLGTYFSARQNKWVARIGLNWKMVSLGCFDTQEAAHHAYLEAKARLHTFNPEPRVFTK